MTTDPMLPVRHRVVGRTQENQDSATLVLEPLDDPLPAFTGGQFTMLCVPGIGEIAISISGDPTLRDGRLVQTIRGVGAVSRALHDAGPGTVVGARGPYGNGWDLASAEGRDVVIVAGGVGLAPLRPAVLEALSRRAAFDRIVLIAGAREPGAFLFGTEPASWAAPGGLELELTVDAPSTGWAGSVGFVTQTLARLELDPSRTVAFVCGPEPMMRFSADLLMTKGVRADQIQVSLERNMQCGVALCGHCQLGPLLLCRDGPVVTYQTARPLMIVREL